MHGWLASCLIVGMLWPGWALAQNPGDAGYLAELRKFSERDHAAQVEAAQQPVADLREKYKAALQQYRNDAQAAGKLKNVVAADKALATLEDGGQVGGSDNPEVANLERIFLTNRAAAEAKAQQAVLKADQTYLATLTGLVERFTKAGAIDAALEAQTRADELAAALKEREQPQAAPGGFGIKVAASYLPHDPKAKPAKSDDVPPPAIDDAATKATFKIIGAEPHKLSGALSVLSDGKLPASENSPPENFFFATGAKGGRLTIDLGTVIPVESVATYSWHLDVRGPQVYVLFGSDGKSAAFNAAPEPGKNPRTSGWQKIAEVDTRVRQADGGGRHSIQISNNGRPLGEFRYLLFDISATNETGDSNTFFSEIDVINATAPRVTRLKP
jgi:hypothetical protein